jgi:hypothetical protein
VASVAAARCHRGTTVRIRIRRKRVRIGAVIIVVWLIIGLVAAGQRGYLGGSSSSCTEAGNIAVTIITGPLNYVGVNPKVECSVPQPSE